MDKLNVAVIFGGFSSEYSVSLHSACGVIEGMDREKFTTVLVGISSHGSWYHYTGDTAKIAADKWQTSEFCTPAVLSPNRDRHCLLRIEDGGVEEIHIDAAFPVLHGRNGEDGTVQGLIELAGIPLVGCGTLSSALCMDKDRAHKLVELAGIRVPRAYTLSPDYSSGNAIAAAEKIGYPLFVKPVKAGSSYGVSKVSGGEELVAAIEAAFSYDNEVIVEEAIPGFEVGCAVMGDEPITGEIDEIELQNGFFDYTEKYNLVTSKIHVPARISAQKSEELKAAAKTIYKALGCKGFARVDMFLTPAGDIVFNEVNTIPGFTSHSRFPGMMRAAGYSMEEIITSLIETAVRGE